MPRAFVQRDRLRDAMGDPHRIVVLQPFADAGQRVPDL